MTFKNNKIMAAKPSAFCSDVLVWATTNEQSYDAICELKKIPARLGKVDEDLASISATMRYFERHIATSPYGAVSRSKDLETACMRGNSRLRTLLTRFHEAQGNITPQVGRDDWDRLISYVEDREGFLERGATFTTGKSRGLTPLRARSAVAPKDLTQNAIDGIVRDATSEKRRSICKGLALLNRLIAEFHDDPELSGLLPISTFDIPTGSDRAARILWTSLPPELRASAESVMESTVAGPKEQVAQARQRIKSGEDPEVVMAELNGISANKRKVPGNPNAAKEGYKAAIRWLIRAAEEEGKIRHDFFDIADLFQSDIIEAACEHQIERSEASDELKNPKETQTLNNRLTALRTLARHGMRRDELVAIVDLYSLIHEEFVIAPGNSRSDEADEMCRLIQHSPHLAASFVNAPKSISEMAEAQLVAAREREDEEAEQRALRLYATAVAFAVQVSRPVRTSNIIRLRHRSCENAKGNLDWIEKGKHARLTFKEREIKNSRVITVHLEDDEAKILWKWMGEYRQRFLKLKGIEDTVYIIPGEAVPRLQKRESNLPRGCVAASTMAEVWDDGARIIGINLTPHQARHAIATLILAIEPGNFAKVASVLGDEKDTVIRHYGRDSGEQAARSVREVLKKRHPGMFRKMKGKG